MTAPRFGIDDSPVFVIDQSRCIGCEACVQACMECGTHRGQSLIHLEHIDRATTTQTAPMICMHCEDPTCAQVCPADAIKQTEGGIVQSALKPRCIGCSNCVIACPFGVPKYFGEIDQMMKCDLCYDRTSAGRKPMCATVCPSQAITFAPASEVARSRRGTPINEFHFGREVVRTKVYVLAPEGAARLNVGLVPGPGKPKPARVKVALLIGLVTTALTAPSRTRLTALSIDCSTAGAAAGSGWPATTGRSTDMRSTGSASAKTNGASARSPSASTATFSPKARARFASTSGSPRKAKGGIGALLRCA